MIESISTAIILRGLGMGVSTLPLFSTLRRCNLFVIIINITNIAIISAIITNSITKDEVDFRPCNTKQKIKTSITMNSSSGGHRRLCLPSPRSCGSSTSTWCTGVGLSQQGSEVPMKVLNRNIILNVAEGMVFHHHRLTISSLHRSSSPGT